MSKKFVKDITLRDEDFALWYTDVCLKAELMDYSAVAGFIIYRPYGFAIWENIKSYLDKEFKKTGHENVYMPLVIAENLFQKEKDHVEGFAPESVYLTTDATSKSDEKLIVRPTSEVLFCEHYRKIVSSYRDLPKKYNQWCNVVRWEKTTRPFLRGKEFLWQEGHTVHATEEEARKEALDMLGVYNDMGKNLLAIPFITGRKTELEKFAGADETYTIEALMHDGKALQSGTTHYFGQNFSVPFEITFQDRDNQLKHAYQTSWGVTTRLIGAVIMVHGDDDGLVLPPYLAPIQTVIVPIQSQREEVIAASNKIKELLEKENIRVRLDDSDKTPGWKFSEYEMKGVPIRVEVGPRDLKENKVTLALRYNREKIQCNLDDVVPTIKKLIPEIHEKMYKRALEHVKKHTHIINDYSEFGKVIAKGGYIKMSIAGEEEELKVKEDHQATARVILNEPLLTEKCLVSGKKATKTILFARAY